jgi:hypothetical protein
MQIILYSLIAVALAIYTLFVEAGVDWGLTRLSVRLRKPRTLRWIVWLLITASFVVVVSRLV